MLVRGHLEASEGLGLLFAERGGELVLATTDAQEAALDRFIDDLGAEMPVWGRSNQAPCPERPPEADHPGATEGGARAPGGGRGEGYPPET